MRQHFKDATITVCLICFINFLMIHLYAATSPATDLPGRPLFRDTDQFREAYPKVNSNIVTRQRIVEIDINWFNQESPHNRCLLNLFKDARYLATHIGTEVKGNGKFAWIGQISSVPESRVTLVVDQDRLSGTISVLNTRYDVRPIGDNRHVIREVDILELTTALELIPQYFLNFNRESNSSAQDFRTTAAMGSEESEVFTLVNEERAIRDISLLNPDDRLTDAARAHSQDMSDNNYFSHTSQDGRTFSQRITAAGYQWNRCAENIAYGYSTPTAVLNGWMNSSGHRANILSDSYCDLGVGYVAAGNYWTQDFGRLQGVSQCTASDNDNPVATFSVTPATGRVPLTVGFDGSASSDSNGDELSFQWDFGDGTSANGSTVSHQYTLPGLYTILLTVSDENGGSDTAETEIVVLSNDNSTPSAMADTFDCELNQSLTIEAPGVLQNDTDPDNPQALAAEQITAPQHGELILERNGAFQYRPEQDYSGEDVFTYAVTDGEFQSDPATVTISIQASENSESGCFLQGISTSFLSNR